MKYIKKVKIAPNFKIEFEILSQGPRKKFGPKIKKKLFCRVPYGALAKWALPSAGPGGTRPNMIFKNKKKLPSAWRWHSAK